MKKNQRESLELDNTINFKKCTDCGQEQNGEVRDNRSIERIQFEQ